MNVDTKLVSEVLIERLKKVLSLLSKNQTAYAKGRFIIEGGRQILDHLEISDNLKIKEVLNDTRYWKSFQLGSHLFLITALEKYGFKENFIKWIQILIQNQESCVINGETPTNYFKLERGARQEPSNFSIYIYKITFLCIM